MPDGDPEVSAMILSGGGAYAAYEIGVMRALFSGKAPSTGYQPLKPGVIAGTSSGAFSAALLSSIYDSDPDTAAERVADVWLNEVADQQDGCGNGVFRYRANPFEGFGEQCYGERRGELLPRFANDSLFLTENLIRRGTQFFTSPSSLQQRLLELPDLSTIISTEPFARLVRRTVSLDLIRSSSIKLAIPATNWKTGDLHIFDNQQMEDSSGHEIIRASASVPGIFPSVDIHDEPYVDGGVVMNSPPKPAIDLSASVLHIVYINPDVVNIPLPKIRSTLNALFRALVINLATSANSDIELARQVNLGIQIMRRPETLRTTSELRVLIRQISGIARHIAQNTSAYRLLTVHRYHPRELYGGLFQWLSFGREHVLTLMQQGFADTLMHDCKANG